LKLLDNKPLDQITVRDIAAVSGAGYSTFFRYFPTKEALFEDVTAGQIERLLGLTMPFLRSGYDRAAAIALFNYINEHRQLWATLLTGGAAGEVRERFLQTYKPFAAKVSRRSDWLPADFAITHVICGTFDLLSWWLQQKEPVPIERVAEIHDRIIVLPVINADETGFWRSLQTAGEKRGSKRKQKKATQPQIPRTKKSS
jgi:AcrR family transcriptional regulator